MLTVRRVVVGVDASPNAREAFQWAATFAAAFDAELVVVHAVGLLEHRSQAAHATDLAWWDALGAPGTRLRRVLRDGNPEIVLEAVLDEEDADLVVVGSRGTGATPSLLLGSTSSQLLQHSRVPVVVVPATAVLGEAESRC